MNRIKTEVKEVSVLLRSIPSLTTARVMPSPRVRAAIRNTYKHPQPTQA